MESTEAPEEDDDGLVEYSIDDLSDEDLGENERGVPPKKAKRPKTPK